MRDSLVFYGVTEAPNGEQESCESIVCNIIRTNLEKEEEIHLERAHRLGRKHDQRPRPFVAKFNTYPQRELVRKTASKLKGISISLWNNFQKKYKRDANSYYLFLEGRKQGGKGSYIDGRSYHQDTDTYTDTRSESEVMQGGSKGDSKSCNGKGQSQQGTTGKVRGEDHADKGDRRRLQALK